MLRYHVTPDPRGVSLFGGSIPDLELAEREEEEEFLVLIQFLPVQIKDTRLRVDGRFEV